MSRTPKPTPLMELSGLPYDPYVPGAEFPVLPEGTVERIPESLADIIDEAVTFALRRKDVRAYMEALATTKPDLFFKYVQLAVEAKRAAAALGAPSGKAAQIISPLAPTALDRPVQ